LKFCDRGTTTKQSATEELRMNTLHANAQKTQALNELKRGICQRVEAPGWVVDLRAGALAEEEALEAEATG
jgi:hypothetical protein